MPSVFPRTPSFSVNIIKTLAISALGTTLLVQAPLADAAEKNNPRYAAFVIDANNGRVLFSENADARRYPASLTKMMTLYMLFEALESGRAKLSTPMKVSAYAASRPPTKLGLKPGSGLTVEEAILGLITLSANDASVVISEFLGGTETHFAEMMTAKAHQLGMSRTTFRNANGLPNLEQSTTARDMATLGIALREHFPQYYGYFSTRSFSFRGRTIRGHNRLLGRVQGVDGIKTGYINASGFNLVSSVVTGNRKLVAVVMGGRTARSRDDHMADLIAQYLPLASARGGEPLVAAWSPGRGPAVTASFVEPQTASFAVPRRVPVPRLKAASIDKRVAEAYGSDPAGAVNAITRSSGGRRVAIGRDALRAALGTDVNASAMLPTANTYGVPIPRASIPTTRDLDSGITGSIAPVAGPASPWVVQIAATPAEATALDMLNEAKARAGAALAGAQPFTQKVDGGGQPLYRARFAGFPTKASANRACDALKRKSYACYTIAN